ncbi:MAG: hypothetical protein ABIO79_04995 [Ferruginibacter sp.]
MKKILAFFSLTMVLGIISCSNESKRTDEVKVNSTTGTTEKVEVEKGTVVVPVPPPPPAPVRPPTPKEVIKSLPKPPLPPLPPPPPLPKRKG